jgi:hypothetical protein
LAEYVGGKGRGKHYYRGVGTNFPYKVKHGEAYYVDPQDARTKTERSNSLFVTVQRDVPEPTPEVAQAVTKLAAEPAVRLTPRVAPEEKTPVEKKAPPRFFKKENEDALPDIANLKWQKEIRHMEFTSAQARQLIKIEEAGKGRVKVLAHLKHFA